MSDLSRYQARREELKQRYLSGGEVVPSPLHTGGVDLLPVANWETDGGRVVASPTVSFAA